jgi:hypothetical protein
MSGKELSKLVAFVKGTQFDLVVRKDIYTHTLNFFLHDIFYCKAILIFWDNFTNTPQTLPTFADTP